MIKINADFNHQVGIRPKNYEWAASPSAGVERMILDRIGYQVAHATTIVKFAPHTIFSPHQHWGGEEIYVVQGTFYDEHGIYPTGTWMRAHI